MVLLRKKTLTLFLLMCVPILAAFAGTDDKVDKTKGLAGISSTIQGQVETFTGLMITVAYIAGIGFTMASIFKFKQHKDNPTQVPIGTPFAMFAVGVIMIFLPAMFAPAGYSIFGKTSPTAGKIAPLMLKDDKT